MMIYEVPEWVSADHGYQAANRTTTATKPRIIEYDKDFRVVNKNPERLDHELETSNLVCHQCGKPADMIGTGHRDEPCQHNQCGCPQPPWFKCAACHLAWYCQMVNALIESEHLDCTCCGGWFETIDEFSLWRPV